MRSRFPLIIIFLISFLTFSCVPSSEGPFAGAKHISVHWELVTNFTGGESGFEARFQLSNHGNLTLSESNWNLFFSMASRRILPDSVAQPAIVEHLSGDWYRMAPAENFSLPPGGQVDVRFFGSYSIVKESDAPEGLYFVFFDGNGNEADTVQVAQYFVEPFVRKEQILRGRADREPLPGPGQRYHENLSVYPIDSESLLKLIPSPVKIVEAEGSFEITGDTPVTYVHGLQNEAGFLRERLASLTGSEFHTSETTSAEGGIHLSLGSVSVNGVSREAYRLSIGGDGVSIQGSDPAGVFYGIQSLLAVVPLDVYMNRQQTISIGYLEIEDAPRFHHRSQHIDVSRNFQTKETLFRIIDILSFYKINHLLLHLTEDEGWRIEIDGLPELTGIGAKREHLGSPAEAGVHPAYGSGPVAYAPETFGSGYYSKQDFVEILNYAKARHVRVIPAVNFPGHARAAIKSMEARYQRLFAEGREEEAEMYRLIDPEDRSVYFSAQSFNDNVVSVARESTYRFYEKVVDEIARLYEQAGLKLEIFHTGGDEVPEGAWTLSPMAAALLETLPGIDDPKNLQIYFFRELNRRLAGKAIQIHGWEEVGLTKAPDGTYHPNPEFARGNVVPYIWNNLFDNADLGYRMANAGYPVILCNVTNFYFDLANDNDPEEPGLYWGGFVNTRNAWTFAPFDFFKTTYKTNMGSPIDTDREFKNMVRLRPAARRNIIGLQAQLWGETVRGNEMLEYHLLPKLLGFAERAWGAERPWENIRDVAIREELIRNEWNIFANTLAVKELPRLSFIYGGYVYRLPLPGAMVEEGFLKANVEFPGLIIRYTTDGAEPDGLSPVYDDPVPFTGTVRLKSFDAAGRSSRTSILE